MQRVSLPGIAIQPLSRTDLTRAATLCARAMRDNPLHLAVFGGPDTRRQQRLQRLLAGLLGYILRKGDLLGAYRNGTLVGVLGLLPPGRCRPTWRDLPRLLPTLLTSNTPAGSLRTAIWLNTWRRHDPGTPHWHLGPLAVEPDWQGQYVGTRLMDYACNRAADACLYLETDTPANVRFYQRFGFSVLATPVILTTPSWLMVRPLSDQHPQPHGDHHEVFSQ
ncbi:GNAT family N-acetyltransferase [Marinobacter sp. X15-166B]|uniref:GNAT family N-acetyltransferase n=1 Tax=Marinobacter sp. X15-166B TaxID=1897620 RepID=UPI00085CB4A4|nr:GNAT family N-acetyltransferase [Marinobacter sp. X15-166B]OEY67670.1 GNAT family N-acetyltransferase [Marinobacter sp. X15-166B]